MAFSAAVGANNPHHPFRSELTPGQQTPAETLPSAASTDRGEVPCDSAKHAQRKALSAVLMSLKPAQADESLAIQECRTRTNMMNLVATGSWMVMAFLPTSPATLVVVIGAVGGFGLLLAATAVDQYTTCQSSAVYGGANPGTVPMHSGGRIRAHAVGKLLQGTAIATHAALLFAGVLNPTLGVGLAGLGVILGLCIAFELMARVADARTAEQQGGVF